MSWRRLGEFLPEGLSYGIVQPGAYFEGGVPIVRVGDMRDRCIQSEDPYRVAPEVAQRFSRTQLCGGELLLAVVGSPGITAVASSSLAGWNVARAIAVLRTSNIDIRWLNYYFSSPSMRSQIDARLNTTVQATLNLDDVKKLLVPDVPIKEQQAIAEVLGALDDKIAVNNAAAERADELVRAMYQGLPWKGLRLSDICSNPRANVLPAGGVVPYVGLEHVPRRRLWIGEMGSSSEVASAKTEFVTGDTLFGKLRPYFHKVVSAPTKGVCSTDILVLRPNEGGMAGLVLAAAASDEIVGEATAKSAGTKMPRANWRDLGACEVRGADDLGTREFSLRVMAIRDAVEMSMRESRTLARLRDTLLPALMDGTLQVREAVARVEEAL